MILSKEDFNMIREIGFEVQKPLIEIVEGMQGRIDSIEERLSKIEAKLGGSDNTETDAVDRKDLEKRLGTINK